MGGVVSAGADNDELIDKLKEAEYIKNPNVERVFRLVDRANYLTQDNRSNAYSDNAWKCGNLHLSAPCIYAQVMEGLKLGDGMKFLNIGSGTGYLSTMAGLLIGSKGVNHGVEIHNDVVLYAREKLSWFLNNSSAIDVTSFCEPEFVQGNGFCLSADFTLYDRVYVGASCPRSHENYMKNLLKVGGVLVMPRNDNLLKITRKSSDEWISEKLLPVSFSTLLGSDKATQDDSVDLPVIEISSLQEQCREVIRQVLRDRVESENHDLCNSFCHSIRVNPRPRRTRSVRRIFPNPNFSFEEESDGGDALHDAQQGAAEQIRVFLGIARSLARNQNQSEEASDASMEEEESLVATVERLIEEQQNIGRSREEEPEEEEDPQVGPAIRVSPPAEGTEGEEVASPAPVEASTSTGGAVSSEEGAPGPVKREKFDSGICVDMEQPLEEEEEEEEDNADGDASSEEEDDCESTLWKTKKKRRRRRKMRAVKSRRSSSSSSEESEGDEEESPSDTYSRLLKAKVQLLPLPMPLKVYVNYNRPL